jgi:hypothetical protein
MNMLNFTAITTANIAHIRCIVEQTGFQSCQLSAGSLYCLAEQYETTICFQNDFLFVAQHRQDIGRCYFMPIGIGNLSDALNELKRYHAAKYETPLILWGIADDMTNILNNALNCNLEFIPDRDWAEYIYESQHLQTLQGKRLQPKRNAAHQFRRKYSNFKYEHISADNIEEVWDYQQNHPQHDGKLNQSVKRGLDIFKIGGFVGGIIRIDNKIEGYTMGCPINRNHFDILFENANKTYNGIFQVLEQELITQQIYDYKYINREEDLGISGIRFAKMGLHPDMLLMKYSTKLPTT